MGLGWTRAYENAVKASSFAPLTYEELAKLARASFGDAGDRYICPFERKEIRKARRKARSMKAPYIVSGRFGKPRRFKHYKSAVKHYKALKAAHGEAYITNIKLGVSVKANTESVHPGKLLDLRSLPVNVPVVLTKVLNSDLFTSPSRLPPVIRSSTERCSRQEVEAGPIIDHEESPKVGVPTLWAGQTSYVKKKLEGIVEKIKHSDVVQAFSTLPPMDDAQRHTLMAIAGLYIGIALSAYSIASSALTKVTLAVPLGR